MPVTSRTARGRSPTRTGITALVALCAGAYVFIVIRSAWIGDDAYISFRTVDNIVAGYGPRWNVAERVQAYTNPLWTWTLVPLYALSGDIYLSAIFLGVACSVAALALVAVGARRESFALPLAILACATSKAFIEYSTAGLENPMLHLVAAAALLEWFREGGPRSGRLAFHASLAYLCRPDAFLLFGVLVLASWLRAPSFRAAGRVCLGLAPLLLWSLFSLVYYGLPLPNTAYAKLAANVPEGAAVPQGLHYLGNSWSWDPVTLATIGCALLVMIARRRRREWTVALAILLQIAYVVRVGGDFMSGRFLTLPFFAAVTVLARTRISSRTALVAATALVVAAASESRNPWRTGPDLRIRDGREATDEHDVTDERKHYYAFSGLLSDGIPGFGTARDESRAAAVMRERSQDGKHAISYGVIGFIGYGVGPDVHIIDPMALADPLLAQLPAFSDDGVLLASLRTEEELGTRTHWRAGHLPRPIPEGYKASLDQDDNRLVSEPLREFYDVVRLLTRAPLFAPGRLRAIVDLQLGRYDHLREAWMHEFRYEGEAPDSR